MKKEYSSIPNAMKTIEFYGFSWIDFEFNQIY